MWAVSGLIISLLGLSIAASTFVNTTINNKLIINKEFFPDELIKFYSEHDIVTIFVPINQYNILNTFTIPSIKAIDENPTVFFVEADITPEGKRIDKGLYIMKGTVVRQLLPNGRDVTAAPGFNLSVFIGTDNGIYVYVASSLYKYGSITDSIIGIAIEKAGDVIYILTEDHDVFKVTNLGSYKEILDDVVNAQQIVIDYSDNLYFYDDDKQIYVRTKNGVEKITGFPQNPSSITLIKPPFILKEGVLVIVDDKVYFMLPNTTLEYVIEYDLKPKLTAFSVEATMMQYFAYNKHIYEYNIQFLVKTGIAQYLEELSFPKRWREN